MKKQILLLLAFFAFTFNSNAQTISIIGDATPGDWAADTNLTTSDNVIYTLSNVTLTNGGLKFRQDGSWTNNWGGSTFLSGTGVPNGSNIIVTAGVYDVTFNLTTKAYSFTAVAQGFSDIYVKGTANGNVAAVMSTTDGINYILLDADLSLGGLQFQEDLVATNTWGDSAFPSGTATLDGNAISVIPGTYDIVFNKNTGVYSFTFPQISIVGPAKLGWPVGNSTSNDFYLTTTDGENYSTSLTAFTTGALKFRKNGNWAVSYGGTGFPNGTSSGSDINVQAGNYVVAFNRITGVYSFNSGYPTISLTSNGVDIDLFTGDGVNYYKNNVDILPGMYKFRQANANDFVWGGSAFPSGTSATYITTSIPVPGKAFNVTFNKNTGAYAFTYVTISIIGDATPGGWGADTNMTTTDGVTYRLNGVSLSRAELKFRQGNDWAKNWGGNAFPTATGTSGGDNIKVYKASVYNITFNRATGKYTFVDTNLVGYHTISIIGDSTPGGWGADTPMTTTNGVNYRLNGVSLLAGELKFRMGNDWATSWGGNYPSGSNSIGGNNIPIPNNSVYNITLNISTGAYTITDIQATKIRPKQCGTTLSSLTTAIETSPVAGATEYTFEITRVDTNEITTVVSPIYYFYPATKIPGVLVYGKSYNVRVKALIGGTYKNFGDNCILTTPALPATKLLTSQCGVTYSNLNFTLNANRISLVTKYRFRVVNGATERIAEVSRNYIVPSDLAGGYANNTVYTVDVATLYNGLWSAYGPACTVTTPFIRMASENINTNIFEVKAFPNPFARNFSLDVQSSSDDLVQVKVYDMIGRELESKKAYVSELGSQEIGTNYPSGIYNIVVSQGEKVKSIRMVKQ